MDRIQYDNMILGGNGKGGQRKASEAQDPAGTEREKSKGRTILATHELWIATTENFIWTNVL